MLLLVLRWRGGPQSFAGAGMAFGSFRIWILYGLGMVLFYGLETLLNYVFKFGTLVDITKLYPPGATAAIPPMALLASAFFNAVIIGPFLGLIITFGEEYGWRGYLQSELVHLGRIRGVGLLGIIWGVWHWPIIWMGYNYPGQPVLGPLLMTALHGGAVVLPGLCRVQIEGRVDGGLPARAQQPGHVLFHGRGGDAGQHGHVLWHRHPRAGSVRAGHPADPARPDLEGNGLVSK